MYIIISIPTKYLVYIFVILAFCSLPSWLKVWSFLSHRIWLPGDGDHSASVPAASPRWLRVNMSEWLDPKIHFGILAAAIAILIQGSFFHYHVSFFLVQGNRFCKRIPFANLGNAWRCTVLGCLDTLTFDPRGLEDFTHILSRKHVCFVWWQYYSWWKNILLHSRGVRKCLTLPEIKGPFS